MVDIIKLKFTMLQQEIIRYLSREAGKKYNARQLAVSLKVSQTAIAKALVFLKNKNIVCIKKESGRLSIWLDRGRQRTLQIKRIENLRTIYDSGLSDFFEKNFLGSTVILFGSYSRGDDVVGSDIDIAIIGEEKNLDLRKFERVLHRDIVVNFYSSFSEIHKNLKENLCNGILLSGGIEL